MRKTHWIMGGVLAALGLGGCNLYGGMDSPHGDVQLLSAARAAFDNGDYDKALSYYQQLSSSYSDVANSEEGFIDLSKNGASMKNIISAFGEHPTPGTSITHLAGTMSTLAGAATRTAIFKSYQTHVTGSTIQDPNLSNFSKFIFGVAILAEILGEQSSNPGTFTGADLVTTPTQCTSDITGNSVTCPNCIRAATSNLSAAGTVPSSLDSASLATYSATIPTDGMINGAANTINSALGALSANASFGTTLTTQLITSTLIASDNGGSHYCYQGLMLSLGIGTN